MPAAVGTVAGAAAAVSAEVKHTAASAKACLESAHALLLLHGDATGLSELQQSTEFFSALLELLGLGA